MTGAFDFWDDPAEDGYSFEDGASGGTIEHPVPAETGNADTVSHVILNEAEEITRLRAEVERLKAALTESGAEHQRLVDAVEEFLEVYEADFTVGDIPTMMRKIAQKLR